jgi:electron transfer flavoprotein beta subunit
VPDTYSERKLNAADGILDRDATDAVLDEINERAVEAALQLEEANNGSEVTVVTMGPDRATDAIRKALSLGADKAVHLQDDALAGSDMVSTAKALAKAIGSVEGGFDVVFAGNEASDGRGGAIPAMVAEVLGAPALTHAREVSVDGSTVTVRRETDDGVTLLTAALPAVVSVSEKINEPRYPSLKGIMAAKKKPVSTIGIGTRSRRSSAGWAWRSRRTWSWRWSSATQRWRSGRCSAPTTGSPGRCWSATAPTSRRSAGWNRWPRDG